MNSLLQCLYYIKELREYFIYKKEEFTNEQPICKEFANVMYGLENEEKDFYEPIEFKKLLGKKNNLFKGYKPADVKDLFFTLIDGLLSELNQENDDDKNNSLENIDSSKLLKMFEVTKKEIEQNNNIINKLFNGYYFMEYCCKNSEINNYSFQNESFILFDLEKIKKNFPRNNISIDLCFKYYCREQLNSSFHCNSCKKPHEGEAFEKIYRPPKILVLILYRGHDKVFTEKVEIKQYLDLKPFIEEKNYEYNSLYKLICVSTHKGESSSSGHYTACCLADNNKYYYFSDMDVYQINKSNLFNMILIYYFIND